jgi:hypothetical protein
MTNSETPSRIRDDISIQQIGGETLVYDELRHKAFCLNRSSSVIWWLADGERTIGEIRREASFQLESKLDEEFVEFALDELQKDGLIESSAIGDAGRAMSRRAMIQRLGVGGAMLLPIVAVIVAPTAAQAYSGCVDCSNAVPSKAKRRQAKVAPSQ